MMALYFLINEKKKSKVSENIYKGDKQNWSYVKKEKGFYLNYCITQS